MATFIICQTIFKQHVYVKLIFIIRYTICKQYMYGIYSPWHVFFKNSHNMLVWLLLYAFCPTRYPTWQCTMGFYGWVSCRQTWSCFDCVITEILTVIVNSQSWQLGKPAWQAVLIVQATIPSAAEGDCVICKATRPGYWFESEHEPGRVWLRNLKKTHQWLPSSQIFLSCSSSTGLTRLF